MSPTMVAFPNLRTPPKLRTPTKLSISFTRRSTPRPTPRSSRGGRVKALIDKFNSANQTKDNKEGDDSLRGTQLLLPVKDKSFLSMDGDKMRAASDNDDSKCATSNGPASAPKVPPGTVSETDKVEKAKEPLQKGLPASADSFSVESFSPLAFTTSTFESINVKKLPYDQDDEEDKENCFAVSGARSRDQSSQIDDSWLAAVKHFSPPTPPVSPVEVESTAKIKVNAPLFQEKHLEQQTSSEKCSTASVQNEVDNSKVTLEEKDLIETICVTNNIQSSHKGEKSEMFNETEEKTSNNKYAKFRNSTIKAIKISSRKNSPNQSMHRIQEESIGSNCQIINGLMKDSIFLDEDELDLTLKGSNHRVAYPSPVMIRDGETNALATIDKSGKDNMSTIGIAQNFNQQARSAMMAAGIESMDADSLNKTNAIIDLDKKSFRESNSNKQNVIDDDLMVTMSNGSESEIFEIVKTRSTIQHQRKGRKMKESPFHEVARNAMTAAEVAKQKRHQKNLSAGKSIDVEDLDNVPVVYGIVEVTTVTSIDETDANVENGNDDDVEEEIFLEDMGTNNILPLPAATHAEECTMIVSASSSTSSRNEETLPVHAPASLPSQPPKVDNAQLLMPYLVSYGNPTKASMPPNYPYYFTGQQWCYYTPQPQPMQYLYYAPPTCSDASTIYIHI